MIFLQPYRRRSLRFAFCVLAMSFSLSALNAADAPKTEVRRAEDPPLTANEILKLVRMSQALQDLKNLDGTLRDDMSGKKVPFDLSMANQSIRFVFKNPNEIINLDLNSKAPVLRRIVPGSDAVVPKSLGNEPVRGTSINYEDLSMRFLYWTDSKLTGEETLKTRRCWRVRVRAPDVSGPYGTVDIWVDQGSGAMMKMEAYDVKAHLVKRFRVVSGQRFNGAWILKEMSVESFDALRPEDVKGRTYMDIKSPD